MTTVERPEMRLPTPASVESRLAELLDEFEPAEVTARQRAEDLVASALALYGAAFRRAREILAGHGDSEIVDAWSSRQPLAGLVALHRADSPAPQPIDDDDVRHAADTVDRIVENLDQASEVVRRRSLGMLAAVVELHEAGLAQIVGVIDDELRPSPGALAALGSDDLLASLLLIHGLHPEPFETRVERVLDELQRLSGPVATVELVSSTDEGLRLRVDGTSPGDAYRLRLNVERTIEERLPDLVSVVIEGGAEPVQPTSVLIPVESLVVRSSGSESKASPE